MYPHADAIQKNYDVLQRCTTINFYVIDHLRAEDVLNEEEENDLKTEKNPLKQRILLYQLLKYVSPDKYESFLQVMKNTEQEHVANLLKGSTEDVHVPLSDERYNRLVKIRPKMMHVTQIDSEVIAELRSLQAISMTDAEEVKAEKYASTKVSKLISIIMRRSNHSYISFHEVLRGTLQKAAANFLVEGEMPEAHVNNNRPDLDGRLSHAFNGVIRNRATDDTDINALLEKMSELGLDPVNARLGHSIVISMYCKTVDDAVQFTQHFNSGRLQCILESIFNRLLLAIEPHNSEKLDSRVSLEEEDITTLEEFTGIEGWMREDLKRPTALRKMHGCDATTQTDEASLKKKTTGGLPEKYKSDPALITTIMAKIKKTVKHSTYGMTILDKELFITSDSSTEVEVYGSVTFGFNRRWDLKELNRPVDIGSCKINKCLYILDVAIPQKINDILRVDSNGKLLNNWSTGNDYGHGLSVTDESTVIFAVSNNNKINEYSPDGQLIREIKLSSDIQYPWHAIKLQNDQFVVSDRYTHYRLSKRRVCMVDEHGKLQKSFGWIYRDTDDPVYMSVDENGFILVADRSNSRVLLLDSHLEFKTKILSQNKHGLRTPTRVLLDEPNGRLIVADNNFWCVDISSFRLE